MARKNQQIQVLGKVITIDPENFISPTDMLKAKDGDFFISDWLRNCNTLEYLGIWERIHNPDFNYGEFATITQKAGLNSYKISVKEWVAKTNGIGIRAKAGRSGGNIRDYANVSQLVCLANLENLNAVWIEEGLPQPERLQRLNQVAIQQMRLLTQDVFNKRLKEAEDE